jgi:hypothetical protein
MGFFTFLGYVHAEPRLINSFTLFFKEACIKLRPIILLIYKYSFLYLRLSSIPPTLPAAFITICGLCILNHLLTSDS